MITASFDAKRKLKKSIPKTQVSLTKVNDYLAGIEQYAAENNLQETCEFRLWEQDHAIFTDDVLFGAGKPYVQSVLSIVNHTLETTFKETSQASKEALINKITAGLQAPPVKEQVTRPQTKSTLKTTPPQPEVVKRTSNKRVQNDEPEPLSARRADYQVVSRQHRNGKRIAFHYQLPRIKMPQIHLSKRLFKIGVSGALILIIGWLGLFSFQLIKHQQQARPAYSTLMAHKDYLKAAELYPKRKVAIETKLSNGPKKTLQTFNTHYPTAEGRFDLAFMNHDWAEVVKVANVKMTRVRKAQLIVAYLKLQQPDAAYRLNLEVHNAKLTQAIALAFIRSGQIDRAESLNKTLKNKDLTDLIDAGKSYQQVIEKYQNELKNPKLSQAERQKAESDLAVWQRNLKTIGE